MAMNLNRDLDGMELTLEQKAAKNQVIGAPFVCPHHYCRCSEVPRGQHNYIQHRRRWWRYSHNDRYHRWYLFYKRGLKFLLITLLNFCQSYLQNIFTCRRHSCLASVQEEDEWRLEGGGAPGEKSKLRFLNKSVSFYIFFLFRFITFLMLHQRKSKLSLLRKCIS